MVDQKMDTYWADYGHQMVNAAAKIPELKGSQRSPQELMSIGLRVGQIGEDAYHLLVPKNIHTAHDQARDHAWLAAQAGVAKGSHVLGVVRKVNGVAQIPDSATLQQHINHAVAGYETEQVTTRRTRLPTKAEIAAAIPPAPAEIPENKKLIDRAENGIAAVVDAGALGLHNRMVALGKRFTPEATGSSSYADDLQPLPAGLGYPAGRDRSGDTLELPSRLSGDTKQLPVPEDLQTRTVPFAAHAVDKVGTARSWRIENGRAVEVLGDVGDASSAATAAALRANPQPFPRLGLSAAQPSGMTGGRADSSPVMAVANAQERGIK